MKSWYNLARAFGARVCRSVVGGGYEAAYSTTQHVKSDQDARAFRSACFAYLHRKAPKVVAQSSTVKSMPARKSVGMAWLVELLAGTKKMALSKAQLAAGYGSLRMQVGVVISTQLVESIAARKRAFWAAIKGFEFFGYKADLNFWKTRALLGQIADSIMSSKDVVTAGIDAAYSWLVSNQ